MILSRRHNRILQMSQGHRYGIVPLKWHLSRHHLIQCDSKGIYIAALIAVSASGLFRGNIMDRAYRIRSYGLAGNCPCDAEIRHLYLSVSGDNHVLGLNVPMDDMMLMSRRDPLGHLDGNADGLLAF